MANPAAHATTISWLVGLKENVFKSESQWMQFLKGLAANRPMLVKSFGPTPAPLDWARVEQPLRFVQLADFEDRPATKLSGGQQQRVALARALVAEPKVILFDEPLSNLDAKLREETRKDLRVFLTELQITAIYVTHDRIEALSLSDIVAVMNKGQIVETGEPRNIYQSIATGFAADFGKAAAIGMSVLATSITLIYIYRYLTSEGEKYVTISSRGYRPTVIELKRAKYPLPCRRHS